MEMQPSKPDKLPLDAKLLSDAVIELNISRRSVGLYPRDHPIVKESIARAFSFLQRLFELRPEMTLGIAEDALVIDEFMLDTKNPVFREFARSLHGKTVAAVTFHSGLTVEELIRFHETVSAKDGPQGLDLAEYGRTAFRHIVVTPVDFTSFTFMEGITSEEDQAGALWQDYLFGLLEGSLSTEEEGGVLSTVLPDELSAFINRSMTPGSTGESYDRVITSYLRKRGSRRISGDSLTRFAAFVQGLRPELKQKFLSHSFRIFGQDLAGVEEAIRDLTPEGFERMTDLLSGDSAAVPEALRRLMGKLSEIRGGAVRGDFGVGDSAIVDDLELGGEVLKVFEEDRDHAFVSEDYRRDLTKMLNVHSQDIPGLEAIREECREETIDRVLLDVLLDLLGADFVDANDYVVLLAKLSDFIQVFVDTGRFEEIAQVFSTLGDESAKGRFGTEAEGMVTNILRSDEFTSRIIGTMRFWGRKEREGAFRLVKTMGTSVIPLLLDALTDETDAGLRKFFLTLIESLGPEVTSHAAMRLQDERWFVKRNMLCLLRECGGSEHVQEIRKWVRHDNRSVSIEAVKSLLHFNAPDGPSQVRVLLQDKDPSVKRVGVRLAGTYRVKAAVPILTTLLEKRELFGGDFPYKADVVKALGEIGDGTAVEPLLRLVKTKTLFGREGNEALKVEVYRNLQNYPPAVVRELVAFGLSSKNDEIRRTSERIAAREKNSRGTGGR